MKFWTIMIISYGVGGLNGAFEDEQSYIPYPSVKDCGEAIEVVFETLADSFPDLMIQCKETKLLSRAVYPRPRPTDLVTE